jgi:hypothetical protein
MSTSLLSFSALDAAGFSALFQGGCCAVHYDTELMLVEPRCDGSYTVHAPRGASAVAVTAHTSAATWHPLLGHAGHDCLAQLVQHGMATGVKATAAAMQELRHQFCEACTLAKLCSAPFCGSNSTSTAPLQLLHMDLAAPFRTRGWSLFVFDAR